MNVQTIFFTWHRLSPLESRRTEENRESNEPRTMDHPMDYQGTVARGILTEKNNVVAILFDV